MAEREDLELQRGPAPEGSEKCGPKSGQQVPKWESKGEQQLPVYQSNRSLREPQAKSAVKRADKRCPTGNRRKKDNFQFINQIGFCENDSRTNASSGKRVTIVQGHPLVGPDQAQRRRPIGGWQPSARLSSVF
jgi:hypothetical protein